MTINPDFLCRIYRYRKTPRRAPREDFLTEVFAELLNALSKIDGGRYVKDLLRLEWSVKLRWSTQRNIPGVGRPDLIGKGTADDGESVYIVVENKVGAGYTKTAQGTQMSRYKRHLEEREEARKALVLITHWTPSVHGVDHVVRWREIGGKLDRWKKEGAFVEFPIAEALTETLVYFLKDKNMSDIKFDLTDIASTSSHRRLIDACAALGEAIKPVAESLDQGFRNAGLATPNSCGEFRPNDYGAPFFGLVWTAGGRKCAGSAAILWAGIWTGVDIYGIAPTVPHVPELSTGLALWSEGDLADEQSDRTGGLLLDLKLPDTKWGLESIPDGEDGRRIDLLRNTRPLSSYYHPGLDWAEEAQNFMAECCYDLRGVDNKSLEAIVQWDKE